MAQAVGVRTSYAAIPAAVRGWVERELGSTVVGAGTQLGGFSPGAAARLVTASGRRAFVKAVGPELNPVTPSLFRQEIVVMQAIDPLRLPAVPRLLAAYDDGHWVALLLEDIDGRIAHHPWTRDDADRVLDAVGELTAALTPSPWPDAPVAGERSREFLAGWERAVADGTEIPDWLDGRQDELLTLARRGVDAVSVDESLVHWDIRSDNLLISDGRVVFVDWAWAGGGASWADLVIVQADIRGSLELPELPDDEDITGFLAAVAGGLWWNSRQPAPPGLPTLRAFQLEFAGAALRWLRTRLGW